MELSTTNGHITIDYLFIYLSIPFVFPLVVRPAYSIDSAASHSKQLIITQSEGRVSNRLRLYGLRCSIEETVLLFMENFLKIDSVTTIGHNNSNIPVESKVVGM